ncbi:MAG: sugar phosphate isomerase/epimerase family protein [Gammaproteobacteria bacterium]
MNSSPLNRSISRRAFSAGLCATACVAATAAMAGRVWPVRLGVQSYSFRDRPLAEALISMQRLGLLECELYSPHIELGGVAAQRVLLGLDSATDETRQRIRDSLRNWRLGASAAYYESIAAQFRRAGVKLVAYNISFRPGHTEAEIDSGFRAARALGVRVINSSSTLSLLPAVARFAERYGMIVGVHNHAGLANPDEIETPQSIEQALRVSPRIGVNLDIGHFVAAGYDPVPFMRAHSERTTMLHVKDRKANDGPAVPFGEGDTPVRQVLLAMRAGRYRFPALIEHEYRGDGNAEVEVQRSLDYCRDVLR